MQQTETEIGLRPAPEDAHLQRATQKLYELLSKRVARYTMGDHSSVPEALAAELLRSVVYTLAEANCTGAALAEADLDAAFARGLRRIEMRTAHARRLWETVCLRTPDFENIALRDTLTNVGDFFKRYDPSFFAHSIPCDIDYQLSRPVGAHLCGVSYIEAYLTRLSHENAALCFFDHDAVTRLLAAYRPDYREMINNLCEPVITNALGCVLTGLDAKRLLLTPRAQTQLSNKLASLPKNALQSTLQSAANRLCAVMNVQSAAWRSDVLWIANEFAARIVPALQNNNIGGIFLA